jgi:hypothetical protein
MIDDIFGDSPKGWNKLYLDTAKKQEDEDRKKRADAEAKRFRNTKPSRPLAAYAGRYEHPAYGTLEVAAETDRLVAAWGGRKSTLRHFHYDTFETVPADWREEPAPLVFRLDREGISASVTFLGQEFGRAK